jgi:hypothetical protein
LGLVVDRSITDVTTNFTLGMPIGATLDCQTKLLTFEDLNESTIGKPIEIRGFVFRFFVSKCCTADVIYEILS